MAQWMGIAGVTILLAAFVLNLLKQLREDGSAYLAMNFVGAALAAWYALDSGSIPFVVLECTWAVAALVRLALGQMKTPA